MKQPLYTCPDINSLVEAMNEAMEHASIIEKKCHKLDYMKGMQIEAASDLEFIRDSAEQVAICCNIADVLEQLRTSNEQLRAYGEYWEEQAKEFQNELNDKVING